MGKKKKDTRATEALGNAYVAMQSVRGAIVTTNAHLRGLRTGMKQLTETVEGLRDDLKHVEAMTQRLSHRLETQEDITRYAEDAPEGPEGTPGPQEPSEAARTAHAKPEALKMWFDSALIPVPPAIARLREQIDATVAKTADERHRLAVRDLDVVGPPVKVYEYQDWKINKTPGGTYIVLFGGSRVLSTTSYDRARAYIDRETSNTEEFG